MSTIFKALQKSNQNPEESENTFTVIREKKFRKKSRLVLILTGAFLGILTAVSLLIYTTGSSYRSPLLQDRILTDSHAEHIEVPKQRSEALSIRTQPITRAPSFEFLEDEGKHSLQSFQETPLKSTHLLSSSDNTIADDLQSEEIIPQKDHVPEKEIEHEREIDTSQYSLQGVAGDEHGYIAIINDNIVGEGEEVNGARIIRITANHVELEKDGQRFLISQ